MSFLVASMFLVLPETVPFFFLQQYCCESIFSLLCSFGRIRFYNLCRSSAIFLSLGYTKAVSYPLLQIVIGLFINKEVLICKFDEMIENFSHTACLQLSGMLFSIAFFHISEYILALIFHGKSNVTLKSLLISKNYLMAMMFSLLEYLIEVYFFPGLKEHQWISNFGLAMVVSGEIVRKLAIITAGRAFTHLIKVNREEHHKLVTHGVYGFVRHPGYSGFLIWSIGTQIMVSNPVSIVAFALVVWHFFSQRIPYEEYFLSQFFGSQYDTYAQQVPSGIPFVN